MKFFPLRRRRDRELEEEIRSHLGMAIRERIERGETPEQAWHAARREFGNEGLIKETTREMWGWTWLENLYQDVRYGLRMLRKNPGFTAIVVAVLALGIGANTAIFSLVDAVLLRSLPVRDPQRLVLLTWHAHHSPGYDDYSSFGDCHLRVGASENPSGCSFSYPMFKRMRAQTKVFSGVTAFAEAGRLDMSGNGPASIVRGQLVSGSFFQTLGIRAAIGRMIRPEDDESSATPVVVLSYGYWKRAFGGDASAVGRTIRLNNVVFTIVGVAPPQFFGITPGSAYDLWLPLSERRVLHVNWGGNLEAATDWWLVILGRLRPGTSPAQAQAAVSVVFQNELLHGPKPLAKAADDPSIVLAPAQQGLNGLRSLIEPVLYLLLLTVGMILLVACANVAGLMLARSATRRREMAVRLALGAPRWRIARQLLTESVLLSLLGGALGCYVAYGGVRLITALTVSNSPEPFPFIVAPDWRVLVFTAAVSILTGILFGLVPAVRSTRIDLMSPLKNGPVDSVAPVGRRWLSLGNALVVAQVALAVVVLTGAGLLVRTLRNLESVKPGFDTNNVLLLAVNPTLLGYKAPRIQNLYRELQTRLAALPGVVSASYSSRALLSGSLHTNSVRIEGQTGKSGLHVDMLAVGPGFFDTMRIPMLAGHKLDSADFAEAASAAAAREKSVALNSARTKPGKSSKPAAQPAAASILPPVPVLVNRAFAHRYLRNRNPVGVELLDAGGSSTVGRRRRWRIVGVVGNAKYNSLRREIHPTIYVPLVAGGAHFELRTATDPTSLIPAVQEAVGRVDQNLPLFDVKTQSTQIQQRLFGERLVTWICGFFGLLALMLACLGLYGLLSYEVGRRTREIGIRMALGAKVRDVHRLVIGRGIVLTLVGATLGLGAAFGVTSFLESLLYGVRPVDPLTFAVVAVFLLLVALAACYLPARRAVRVDPMTVLRFE